MLASLNCKGQRDGRQRGIIDRPEIMRGRGGVADSLSHNHVNRHSQLEGTREGEKPCGIEYS